MHDSTHLKPHLDHRRRREPPLHRRRHCTTLPLPSVPSTPEAPPGPPDPIPGRVSPISDHPVVPQSTSQNQTLPKSPLTPADSEISAKDEGNLGLFDVRLNLKGKNGRSLVLELGSDVLIANSPVFADLISDHRKNLSGLCRIEVPDVENLNVFRETIELMFEEDIQKKLLKIGVFRAIDILEVFIVHISFSRVRKQATDVLDRLFTLNSVDSQRTLTKHLIWSITNSTDANARNELKSLVKGLLCKSSVYEKDYPDLNKEDIFAVCKSCLGSLSSLLEEASSTDASLKLTKNKKDRPLIERISKQVDNINWLLDILLDHQMAEDFADMWANQEELLKMHHNASPMVRYELSRVSALLFIALGTRKLHCPSETRLKLLQVWFSPMLSDFGWLQRCKKGLDMKALEEAMGQALLTLPLKEQYSLFMDWFQCFSKHGSECPNLSKSFQIWWRRSFLRGSETFAIESR
ncbi:BTB/POZ domain-containing protein [Sesamum angolense]|uniref:BTB/POZ domain-containing protein n=1 Tax=Sesamum angolense TaxID=2727404 RepID=A0AAE1WIF6_9LAMI|nr:BTB/POZ domain-containing protein [Sesamum angolense]